MKYTKILTSVALASLLSVGFTACSDSDSGSGSTSSTAYYLDSAVEGVEYDNGRGLSGETNAEGAFKFQDGDTVTFKIGGLLLRAQSGFTNGQKFVETDDNVITLLQSIDADGDASNGITITPIVKEQLAIWLDGATSVEINATDGKLNNIDELISALEAEGLTPEAVTVEDAREHVEETIKEAAASDDTKSLGDQTIVGDTIHYIDYKDEVRSSELSAAAAEYHTGTGYGNTLFGSADKKCQNCHNELYDTWKGSMHGKSWTDPIFQSKFQDFLRTHLNKIGQHPNSDGDLTTTDDGIEYTEAKFKGAAQTCIKCHAPGAYYAGDVSVSLTKLKEGSVATQDLVDAKALHEVTDPNGEIAVVAANSVKDVLYKATFQIGHEANREGINCAFCHSIETPRLMGVGNDGNSYTLANAMRVGPHGPLKGNVGDVFTYDVNASNADMNKFFRLWGPEKYADYANTPKDAADFDAGKSKDGRYTMHSIDLNGTDGKVHFTGGPFYGPYGVTGVSNENATDETDRAAHVNPHFDVDNNNHFGESGKGLCLSCHQRSAGAAVPGGEEGAGMFMELCSTQIAVSTGGDSGSNDSLSSPKCQKCHMERIEGTVLHQWARPDKLWTLADNPALTGHFDPEDPDAYGEDNPVAAGWLNSHAFLGASKTGHKTSATAKIKSGFSADMTTSSDGNTLTVTTTFTNKTAHMFPGAHPMRRALSRVIVTDADGNEINATSTVGISTFGDIVNSVQPLSDKTLHSSAEAQVSVNDNGSADITFPGKTPDLDGSAVNSQKFDGSAVTIGGTDSTIGSQEVTNGATTGTVSNAAIVNSADASNFTRIYGHETGKKYDHDSNASTPSVFVVRPGFDSNMVGGDTRLSPNETEIYTLEYDISSVTGAVSATYKIYYMQKGANGKFLAGTDGWLDQALSDSKKLLVTEVFTKTETE